MCIENNKCFNCFSLPVGVALIGLSTVPEAASYYILDNIVMIIFPILTLILFSFLLLLKNKVWFKKITSLIYLVLTIVQLLVWAFLTY